MEVKKESRVNPGDIVPGGFSYPNNAVVRGDTLYLRDANGNQIPGRSVSNGDKITVLDVGYSKQLALVQYPTSSGVRQGYVTNATKIIQYLNPYNWVNGSTPEPVYSTPTSNDSNFGTLSPRETATLLYKEGNRYHVVYDTGKGPHTKSGYVNYAGAGGSGGSGGSDSNGIKPGEIVPGGFSYPNNAVVRGDTLYLRDANGNQIPGRSVSNGDHITVLDVGYSKQLALVQYPTSSGVRQGYVTNATKIIQYLTPYNWVNGSTPEPVYSTSTSNDSNFGTLNPREAATLLYKKGNRYHVVYDTGKGPHTKSGYVNYAGTGGSGGSGGSDSNGVKPGEIVPGGFSYPNNAVVRGDTLYLRDANGNQISGRSVSNGDHITVLDVGYSKQLALVQYPTSSGVRQGYVTNATKIIQYLTPYNWVNGSTPEPVYSTSTSNDSNFGTLNPREAATLLYKKGNRYHVVYDTGKGPHTKSGYVNYAGTGGSGGSGNGNDTSIQIPYVSHSQASREQYGTSGKGRPLYAYKIGSGSKVLFAGFALHGWEDNWNNDGLALVKIANELITRLGDYKSKNNGLHGWTVYIAPCMNPDGVIVNGSNKGPGRCTVTTRVDMNRCFPYNFSPQYSSENYTGPNPLGAPEAVALKNFVQKINSQSSEMIVIDCHGWMNFTQGNAQIGKYFGNQFGFGHNNRYSSGFFSSWATTLKNTKGVLLEYPTSTYSYNDVINKNYIGKTFNGIVNILKNNPGSDSGSNLEKDMLKYAGNTGLFEGSNLEFEYFGQKIPLGGISIIPLITLEGEIAFSEKLIGPYKSINTTFSAEELAFSLSNDLSDCKVTTDFDKDTLKLSLKKFTTGVNISDHVKYYIEVNIDGSVTILLESYFSYDLGSQSSTIYQRLYVTISPNSGPAYRAQIPVATTEPSKVPSDLANVFFTVTVSAATAVVLVAIPWAHVATAATGCVLWAVNFLMASPMLIRS